jgi:endonuclease-3
MKRLNKQQIVELIETLKHTYPDATCSLDFTTPFELVIAVMLSAQCTDERVNKTTPMLFAKYKTPVDFLDINIEELENIIHPCGFYKNKAKNIKSCAKKIVEDFNGEVPHTMEELLLLPGVGRKSANVILLEAFGIANGIAVDTHAKRISNRMGLSNESEPEKIEQDLLKIFPKEDLKDINHLLVWHGRYTCNARKPNCENCTVKQFCKTYNEKKQ